MRAHINSILKLIFLFQSPFSYLPIVGDAPFFSSVKNASFSSNVLRSLNVFVQMDASPPISHLSTCQSKGLLYVCFLHFRFNMLFPNQKRFL